MKSYTAVIEKCTETGLYMGYIPGLPGAHSQGETLDELKQNMHEVLQMILEDGEPLLEGEFIGTQLISA
jgi:predicted RNase H-like HicB family nuclease